MHGGPTTKQHHAQRRRGAAQLACAALAATIGLGAAAQDQRPIFRSGVDITRIKVAVLDEAGQPVAGLEREDFRVFEDGAELDLDVVLAPSDIPLDLAIVIDFSASVDAEWPDPKPREAAEQFLDSLGPDDCVYLLPFQSAVGPGVWGAADDPAIHDLVNSYPYGWSTRLYDALRDAHAALDARAPDYSFIEPPQGTGRGCGFPLGADDVNQRRAAIVVLSDGEDTGSELQYADVLLASHEAGRPVFSVAVGMAGDRPRRSRYLSLQAYRADADYGESLQDQLAEISRVSGGQLVSQRDIEDGYEDVLALLRGYYVLGYRTPQPVEEGWHGVRVEIDADHQVVTQPGVYRTNTDYRAVRGALRRATELQGSAPEETLAMLDVASQLAPDLAVPAFGRGVLLERLGRLGPARAAMERALWLSPGTPAARSRLAGLALRLNDPSAAWTHALRLRRVGGDARRFLSELEKGSVEPQGREALLRGPRLGLPKPLAPDLEAQLTLRPIWRSMGHAFEQDPTVTVAPYRSAIDFLVRMELRELQVSEPRRMDLRLQLVDVGERKEEELQLVVGDVDDAAEVATVLQTAVDQALTWIHDRMARRN